MQPIKTIKAIVLVDLSYHLPSGRVKETPAGSEVDLLIIRKGTPFYNERTKTVESAKEDRYMVGQGADFIEVLREEVGIIQ